MPGDLTSNPKLEDDCEMCGGVGEITSTDHGDVPCPDCCARECEGYRQEIARLQHDLDKALANHSADLTADAPKPQAARAELRASIEGLAEAYERQATISNAHGGQTAEAWQTVADDLRSLMEQDAPSEPPTGWQPIETAPTSDDVLVAVPREKGGFSVGEAHFVGDSSGGWYWAGNDPSDHWGGPITPTHWMPLPEPPRESLTKEGSL